MDTDRIKGLRKAALKVAHAWPAGGPTDLLNTGKAEAYAEVLELAEGGDVYFDVVRDLEGGGAMVIASGERDRDSAQTIVDHFATQDPEGTYGLVRVTRQRLNKEN